MVFSIADLASRVYARDKSYRGVLKHSHVRDQQTVYSPRATDWLEEPVMWGIDPGCADTI